MAAMGPLFVCDYKKWQSPASVEFFLTSVKVYTEKLSTKLILTKKKNVFQIVCFNLFV